MSFVLSEELARTLQELAAAWRARGPVALRETYAETDGKAPDVLLVKTPSDGIPSYTTGFGTGTAPDTISGVDCQVYELNTSTGVLELHPHMTEKVWNHTVAAVPGSTVVLVTRDRFGAYFVNGLVAALRKGRLNSEMPMDGSAFMSVWEYNGTIEVDTGEDIQVFDWLLGVGQTIAANTYVIVGLINGRWYVLAAQCA